MAYMCADSGNLMAIAQQVIQQKQQRQRQQQQHQDAIVAGNAGDGHHLVPVASHWGGALQQSSSRDHFPYSAPEPIFSDPFASVDDPVDMLGMSSPGLLDHASFRLSDFGATAAAAISTGGFDSDEWMESLIGESPTDDSPNFMSRNLWQGTGARSDLPALYTDAFVSCSTTLSLPPQATSSDLERVVFPGSHEIVPPPATDSVLSASSQSLPFDRPKASPPKDAVGDGDSVPSNSKSTPFLFKSLLDCARIVDSEPDLAANAIMQVRDLSSNRGNPNERIAFYFAEALYQRLSASETTSLSNDFSEEEMTLSYTAFNDACPYSKFVHLTTNQAILEATESADSIHIVDFGISHGVQWAALLQALATRPTGKPSSSGYPASPQPPTVLRRRPPRATVCSNSPASWASNLRLNR
ncbi:hypothetical protein HPP92_023608 [Vanilla planifolia]|uniref:Uncharacterized protein n=1 Tax=Vanilla planifolia TaxID=51239 RepID=A0A835PQM9_VANPL|nr:hypothetical protein HPP92_023608 [Vanilla planifolia]